MKDFHVRRSAHWIAISLLLGVTACGGDSGTNGGDDPTSVTIGDNFFNPTSNTVPSGATVTWTWTGNSPHNVTFASNAIANSVTQSSGTYQVAMPTAAGSYTYQCTIHPTQMNGTVTVQ